MHDRCQRIAIPRRLRGAALLVMLVILVLGIAALLIGSLNSTALQNERDSTTAAALAQAREALIGYAMTYADTHTTTPQVDGYLPCPDSDASNGEGSSKLSCGSQDVSTLGRLPWRTLDLQPLRDGAGECLWYALSGSYKNNPKTSLMNWDTSGLLSVSDANGNTVPDVVAVIFAPGTPLAGQDRSPSGDAPICGGNYVAANYLDNDGTHDNSSVSSAANAVSNFFSGASSRVNDRLLYITRQDIWNAMLKRSDFTTTLNNMTRKVAECIAGFGKLNGSPNDPDNKSLPWPAPLVLADYGDDSSYNDMYGLYAGRVPYQVDTSITATGNTGSSSLLAAGSCSVTGWSATYPWWDNWKDHLFYAIGQEFQPTSGETSGCGTCLQVNGSGQYAAVVMFAGQALSGQDRTDKSVLGAYLEGRNSGNYPNSGGNGNYQSAAGSGTFNDVLYCIDQNLNVAACPQ